ncbi:MULTISPECIES: SAM-dependent methyltransferase [unclassified Streptomyces]|uniref:SAM-dependent methyltransferase n=1 Tax=unclassified Streptomyces TaxID=2593676 RepID=UPI0023B974AC|nr:MULTISPECIES: SAM-dependent methyltransferase [Streptomyces]
MPGQGQDGTNTDLGQDRAHSARMYDYYLGGKTNYLVDREAAQEVIRVFPAIETVAKVNRAYMHRAVRYLAEQGIRQFIDVGTGIPTSPNLHDVAQEVAPDCRVVYVDNDPIVLVYADELLDGTPEGRTAYVQANATKPDEVWAAVRERGILDPELPVALSLHALMHFVTDSQEPYDIVRSLLEPLPSGSYLSLSHCTGEFDPEAWQAIIDTYAEAGTSVQVRGRTEVRRFFDGLELVDPGVVLAHQWHPRPGSGPGVLSERQVSLYTGVARKP